MLRRLHYIVLGIYLVAWFLPVYAVPEGTVVGAQAYLSTALLTIGWIANPQFEPGFLLTWMSPHTNYLPMFSIIAAHRWKARGLRNLSMSLFAAGTINSVWHFVFSNSEIRFGYYVWLVSFPLLGFTMIAFSRKRSLDRQAHTSVS